MSKSMVAKYVHDCDECVFLGTVREQRGMVDLYVHDRTADGWSSELIRRYSSEGSEYGCLTVWDNWRIADAMGQYREVYRRARAAGVIEAQEIPLRGDTEDEQADDMLYRLQMRLYHVEGFSRDEVNAVLEAAWGVGEPESEPVRITGVDSEGLCVRCRYIKSHAGGCGEPCV